jgi:acyl-CoA thioester hydrolase
MLSLKLDPRFVETDALGHINNTVLPAWFEQARTPIFRLFTPDLDVNKWVLILAKIEVEYKKELFYAKEVEIKTFVERVGNSSFEVYQEAWQDGELGASGRATLVHFDHQAKCSRPIDAEIRMQLEAHFKSL